MSTPVNRKCDIGVESFLLGPSLPTPHTQQRGNDEDHPRHHHPPQSCNVATTTTMPTPSLATVSQARPGWALFFHFICCR